MTAHEVKPDTYESPYRKAKDIKREPLREKTDQETLSEMEDLVKRNKRVLQILAEL